MEIFYSPRFAKAYKKLPLKIKLLAEKQEKIFRSNPHHPSLKTHQLKGKIKGLWAFSIDYHYRIIFEFKNNNIIWFHAVGTHGIYH